MPWTSMRDVPDSLRTLGGVRLTLDQANAIARCADALIEDGRKQNSAWAICVSAFERTHRKTADGWKLKP